MSTKDDFRFVRAWWEVSPVHLATGTLKTTPEQFLELTFSGAKWVSYAKGGEFSPYYANLSLVVNWEANGAELEKHLIAKYPYLGGNANWVLHRESAYFREGITWP